MKTTKAELAEMAAGDRKQSLAQMGMTIATGSLRGHVALKAKRKRERQNRRAGRGG